MTTALSTRFTDRFQLSTPVALAPMALASGGALASATARAGALGLVGGGYGDLAWTQREYTLALSAMGTGRIGCGFNLGHHHFERGVVTGFHFIRLRNCAKSKAADGGGEYKFQHNQCPLGFSLAFLPALPNHIAPITHHSRRCDARPCDLP